MQLALCSLAQLSSHSFLLRVHAFSKPRASSPRSLLATNVCVGSIPSSSHTLALSPHLQRSHFTTQSAVPRVLGSQRSPLCARTASTSAMLRPVTASRFAAQ